MALPDNLCLYSEVVVKGVQAAGGGISRPCYNVFWYKRANGVAPLSEAVFNAAFITNVITPLLAAANIRYTPVQVVTRMADDPTRLGVSTLAPGAGAIATDAQPQQNQVTMILFTGYRGSAGRGAKRFGAVNEIDTTNDVLTGAGLARWQAVRAACALTFLDANANSWTPYVVSKEHSDLTLLPQASIFANAIINVQLDKNINTLKRRKTTPVL